jgi:hypothetical protein
MKNVSKQRVFLKFLSDNNMDKVNGPATIKETKYREYLRASRG